MKCGQMSWREKPKNSKRNRYIGDQLVTVNSFCIYIVQFMWVYTCVNTICSILSFLYAWRCCQLLLYVTSTHPTNSTQYYTIHRCQLTYVVRRDVSNGYHCPTVLLSHSSSSCLILMNSRQAVNESHVLLDMCWQILT